MKQSYFTISKTSTIRDAFVCINNNKLGIVFITNNQNQVIGCATDGDIRPKLLEGIKLDDSIILCCSPHQKIRVFAFQFSAIQRLSIKMK